MPNDNLRRMAVIYVSGPYRAATEWGVAENIRKAELAAAELWKRNWAVICPHKNTAFFGGMCPDSVWLDGDLEMVRRCDAIFLLRAWEQSAGARTELAAAKECGLKIFYEHEGYPEVYDA